MFLFYQGWLIFVRGKILLSGGFGFTLIRYISSYKLTVLYILSFVFFCLLVFLFV